MKFLLSILIYLFLFISCKKEDDRNYIPQIHDSIPVTKSVLQTSKMLEGGYKIIGIEEKGKSFEVKNLSQKNEEYLIKCFQYNELLNDNESFNDREIGLVDETQFPMVMPKPPAMVFSEESYEIANDLKVFVDVSQILNMPNYTDNSDVIVKLEKGMDDVEAYSKTIKDSYKRYYKPSKEVTQAFAVFVFNESDSIISLDLKDGFLLMLQEAKNENGEWKPIEYYESFTDCGNSFQRKKLLPDYYAVSKVYKYKGGFKTQLRLKLMSNHKIYYSNEFVGFINPKQFELPKYILNKSIESRGKYFFEN